MRHYDLDDRTIGRILADKARTVGDRPFLTFGGERWTYADTHALTSSYAEGFRRMGVRRGDHVALMLPNRPELLWAIWGLGKLGSVAVPINTAAKGELLTYLLDQSDSVLLCAEDGDRDRVDAAVTAVPALRDVIGPERLAEFAELPSGDPPEMAEVGPSDPHLIMYTSGTTGPSKGVVCPHSQGHAVGLQMASLSALPARRRPVHVSAGVPRQRAVVHDRRGAVGRRLRRAVWASPPAGSGTRSESRRHRLQRARRHGEHHLEQPPSPRDRDHRVRIAMMVPSSRELADGFAQRYGIGVTSVYAMTENCAVTVFGPGRPSGEGVLGRPGARLHERAGRRRRPAAPATRRGRRDLHPAQRAGQHHARLLRHARRDRLCLLEIRSGRRLSFRASVPKRHEIALARLGPRSSGHTNNQQDAKRTRRDYSRMGDSVANIRLCTRFLILLNHYPLNFSDGLGWLGSQLE